MNSLGYWVLAIVALGFLIIVHEAGHYFVARWCGMRVERFSIGFGPGILKRRNKHGTVFQLAPIPFGGFVEIRGMTIAEDVDPDDTGAYPNRPAWQRFATIFAGPGTNYLSAVVLAMGLFTCRGVPSDTAYVGVYEVLAGKGYDAEGKLQANDRILAVDGVPLFAGIAPSLTERVTAKQGAAVNLTIERNKVRQEVAISPRLDKDKEGRPVYYLGIKPSAQREMMDVGVLHSAKLAVAYPVEQTQRILAGLYDIIRGAEKADPAGPVRIVDEFRKAFTYSWAVGIELLMMLSVYLGLFNLLPLPALDGGRLVFLGYELVTRRRANPKIEAMVHMGGVLVLGVVMILVTLNDCNVI